MVFGRAPWASVNAAASAVMSEVDEHEEHAAHLSDSSHVRIRLGELHGILPCGACMHAPCLQSLASKAGPAR